MPQLNPLDWAPQIIWLVITFGILYVLMKRVALPRIGSVIEARHARIAGDIEAADKLRRETQEAIAAYEQALAEAKARAHAIAQEASNKLKDEVAAERAALDRELAARSAEAERRIHQAKTSALKDVNAVASETAAEIVRSLIGVAPCQARGLGRGRRSAQGVTHGIPLTPEFWVAVSFFLFLGGLFYFGVHKKVATLLDARAAQIAKELEEARRLREEAEKVLADYRRKQSEAASEADSIIALAAKEAEIARRRDAEIGEGAFRAPHEARRGQDRPRRG